jgi:hypothetical protein
VAGLDILSLMGKNHAAALEYGPGGRGDAVGLRKRRHIMGSVREIKNTRVKSFCDDVYTELETMRMKILMMNHEFSMTYGDEEEPLKMFKRHLAELADQIEWKLQILSHTCPYDWKGSKEKVESTVSVNQPETSAGPEFSGGYLGG